MNARFLISLSGGGYRASLFNAGVLRVLYDCGILSINHKPDRQFVFVNAVSGGTIPASIWNRFLRSQEYNSDPSSMLAEEVLLNLVEESPRLFGRFNWHFRGSLIFAQTAWSNFLQHWWKNLPMTEYTHKLFSDYTPFISPGNSQCYPVFLFETLDYNHGRILTYHEGSIFSVDSNFFEYGVPLKLVARGISPPIALVAATAFPIFFPQLSVGLTKLIDAGLVDNQAIYGFHPLIKSNFYNILDSKDCWFFSNAGRAMNVSKKDTSDPLSLNPVVEKLTLFDRIFRLTGDLAQPKMNEFIMDLVKSGFKSKIFGVDIAHSHLDQNMWIEGDNIKTPDQAATLPTALSGLGRPDALALISYGAQCAANALALGSVEREQIKSRLESVRKNWSAKT